jgi:hypothetical protein
MKLLDIPAWITNYTTNYHSDQTLTRSVAVVVVATGDAEVLHAQQFFVVVPLRDPRMAASLAMC